MAIDDGTARSNGVDRRTVLTTSAWAAPAVMIAVAAPAAAASTQPGRSTLGFSNSSAFFPTGAPWYQIFVGLEAVGTATDAPVTSVVMLLTIESTEGELEFEQAEFNAGSDVGWIEPELDPVSRQFTLTWSGGPLQAGTATASVAPIGFKIHATSAAQPTSFTVSAFSPQAEDSDPMVQPLDG